MEARIVQIPKMTVRPQPLVAMGYRGSKRSTRRAVAEVKQAWQAGRRRYRPWIPYLNLVLGGDRVLAVSPHGGARGRYESREAQTVDHGPGLDFLNGPWMAGVAVHRHASVFKQLRWLG
jgi:hypothetical protein